MGVVVGRERTLACLKGGYRHLHLSVLARLASRS